MSRPLRLRLLAAHTHAGVALPAGSVHAFDATRARWLIALGVAEPVADQAAGARPPPRAGASRSRSRSSSRKD